MGITRAQATPENAATGSAISVSVTFTFGTTPTPGNFIVVEFATYGGDQAPVAVTVTDNQGNTYHSAGSPLPTNGADSYIYYAYNIAASGTFTITAKKTQGAGGSIGLQIRGLAVEYDDFGTADPLVGFGHSSSASCSTSITGAPEVLVVGVVSGARLNFNVTSITVGAQTPPFTQDWERLSSTPFTLIGEADSRIVSSGAAQSISWTINTSATGVNSMIAAFYSVPPPGLIKMTQMAREVAEEGATAVVRLTQMAREVVYPFTCVPGNLTAVRLTQLPVTVAYDYAVLQPFVQDGGLDWVTPPKALT